MLSFSLGIVVSVALSVACNIHIGEKERGSCVSDVSTVHALVFFSIFRWTVGRIRKFLGPKLYAPQEKSSLKISAFIISRVGGILTNKQTNRQTQWDSIALEGKIKGVDWFFDKYFFSLIHG